MTEKKRNRIMVLSLMIFLLVAFILTLFITSQGNTAAGNMYWNKKYTKELSASIISESDSQLEKTEKIRTFFSQNFQYNFVDESNISDFQSPDIEEFVNNGYGLCYDFATSFAGVCRSNNIKCLVVSGTHNGIKHIWNMVNIDDEWWFVDVAQDSYNYHMGDKELGIIRIKDNMTVPNGYEIEKFM